MSTYDNRALLSGHLERIAQWLEAEFGTRSVSVTEPGFGLPAGLRLDARGHSTDMNFSVAVYEPLSRPSAEPIEMLQMLSLLVGDIPPIAFGEVAAAVVRAEPILGNASVDTDDQLDVFLRYAMPIATLDRDAFLGVLDWYQMAAADLAGSLSRVVRTYGGEEYARSL